MVRLSKILFYKWWYIRRPIKWLSPLISIFEKQKIRKYGTLPSHNSPVFIIGIPRSGTTILYQLVTQIFNVSYFNNFINLSRENLYFGCWLSHKIFQGKPHNSYVSNYGNTKDSGLSAPSEIGNFWYRWIPKDQIIIDENSISIDDKKAIIKNINSIINRYSKPLVIKNLYFVLRIRLIKELFPNAKFIYLKRDRLYVAQSIYLARTKNSKNPQSEWWSLNFPGYESLLTLPIEEQIAQQVYQLENLIQNELSEIFKENIMEIKYEELELNSIEKQFKSFIGTEKRKTFSLDQASFISGNTQKVDDDIFFRLKRELDKIFTE